MCKQATKDRLAKALSDGAALRSNMDALLSGLFDRHVHEWRPASNPEWFVCEGCGDRVSQPRVLGDGVAIHEWHPGPA